MQLIMFKEASARLTANISSEAIEARRPRDDAFRLKEQTVNSEYYIWKTALQDEGQTTRPSEK